MIKPKNLQKGDKVAIVSLSSGMLGEEFCAHNLALGKKRLEEFGLIPVFMPHSLKGLDYIKQHPEKRAEDLKKAFLEPSIKGIICAIGGDDTYRTVPYLMEDEEFLQGVKNNPKLFTGFSDSTVNHFMFYQLGLQTFYGPSFITDLGEIASEMLPYTKNAFAKYFTGITKENITPSPLWYEERLDFSVNALKTERISHKEKRGYELLQGADNFSGELLGGCLESIYDLLTGTRYGDEKKISEKYQLFPSLATWKEKIMFLETSEEKPTPELFQKELEAVKETGAFQVISGIIFGKPQDETYYEDYKKIILQVVNNESLPILFNVNFGHATPRTVLPYGEKVLVSSQDQTISFI